MSLCLLVFAFLLGTSCGDDDEGSAATPDATGSPTPAATPLPPDAAAGTAMFRDFVTAVQADDVAKAWSLYAASIEGTTEEHNSAYGCDFGAFSYEFPRLKHLFERMAPFRVTETYGAAPGSIIIEMRLLGANGTSFLGTVVRVQPLEEYRVQFLNSGQVSVVPGAPDPQPSPDDPTGICGMWTGGR
ncbi:MAG TPA: hypothetical protein VFP63_05530 [Dehalococcoidia bacterium]|nr:hypothetical protein [Dehalococcoidia bacterium]